MLGTNLTLQLVHRNTGAERDKYPDQESPSVSPKTCLFYTKLAFKF